MNEICKAKSGRKNKAMHNKRTNNNVKLKIYVCVKDLNQKRKQFKFPKAKKTKNGKAKKLTRGNGEMKPEARRKCAGLK